jgi:hypothetical protein
MQSGRRRLRRGAARLALAVTAVCAPLVAVMAGSGTGLAADAGVSAVGAGTAGCLNTYCWAPSSVSLDL